MPERKFLPLGIGIFTTVLIVDQLTKYLISLNPVGTGSQILPGIWFTYVQNTGILWGQLKGANTALIFISLIAFGALLYFYEEFTTWWEKVAYSCIMAGIVGNFIDRILRGFVVDFIDLRWFPVFNLSDSAICIGILLFFIQQMRQNSSKSSSFSK